MSTSATSVANVIATHFTSRRRRRESFFASSPADGAGSAMVPAVGSTVGFAAGWRVIQRITAPGDQEQEPGAAVQRQGDA